MWYLPKLMIKIENFFLKRQMLIQSQNSDLKAGILGQVFVEVRLDDLKGLS